MEKIKKLFGFIIRKIKSIFLFVKAHNTFEPEYYYYLHKRKTMLNEIKRNYLKIGRLKKTLKDLDKDSFKNNCNKEKYIKTLQEIQVIEQKIKDLKFSLLRLEEED